MVGDPPLLPEQFQHLLEPPAPRVRS